MVGGYILPARILLYERPRTHRLQWRLHAIEGESMEAEWSRPDAAEQLGQGVFLSVPEPVERSKGSETAEGTS